MNDEIFFDGVRYVSAGQAASFLGVTRDYVARLCKETKLTGRRVGREWYVSNDSLRNFLVDHEYTKARRREDLAATRRHEYQVNSQNVGRAAETLPSYASVVASSAPRWQAPAFREASPRVTTSRRSYAHEALTRAMNAEVHNIISSDPLVAAAGNLRVPIQALTPGLDMLHKLVALMVAVLFTAGTYAFIDAEYARITLREAPSVASSIVESARVQLAAVAANPPRALTDLFARLARAVNTRVNTFVYSIAFPESLVPRYAADAPSGVVSVRVSAGKAPVPTAPVSSLANATTSPMPRTATTQAQSAGEQSTGGVTSRQVIEPPSAQGYGGAQRVIEQRIVSAGGISEEILNARLQQLDNKLMSLIYGASSAPGPVTYVSTPPASGGITNNVALTNHIDQLADVTISGGTITGTAISGGTITDAVIAGGSLSGASVSATTLSSSGATSLATTTVTGDLTVTGAISLTGPSTFTQASTSLLSVHTKAYFGGSATSTFDSAGNLFAAGTVGIGTTSPWKMLSVAGDIIGTNLTATGTLAVSGASAFTGLASFTQASTTRFSVFDKAYFGGSATSTFDSAGNLAVAGTLGVTGNTTLANATTTNLYSTTASSTNLFSTNGTIGVLSAGTLNLSGLATFANGFVSQASSTVAGDFTTTGTNAFTGASAFTGLASFTQASTTRFSVFDKAYFGGTATSTFDSAGNLAVAGTLGVTGNTTLSNATTTNLFSTTASSTNLYSTNGTIGVLSAGTLNLTTLSATNGTFSGTLGVTGLSTLGQASTTLFSSYGPAYFGATATSSFSTTGALTLVNALTYGGVTLSNAVTGTGNMVLSASPTFTGTIAAAALNTSGVITSTATGANTFPYASSTALTVSGHCVTADTRLRRRRRRSDGSYEYDEPEVVDLEAGDEIQSLDEKTGELVWSRVNRVMFMGVKQTYRIVTEDGRTIRTTTEHPYLVKNAKGKWLKHRTALTARSYLAVPNAGWATVANLREGDEIAVASTDDFGNAFGNLGESLGRESAEFGANEPLVNRYDLADEHDSFSEQAGALLFRAFYMIVATLGRRLGLRGERDQNNIFARAIENIGGNNESGTLFERTEIGKGKRNNDYVPAFIPGHRSNPDRYSRTRTTAPQASEGRYPQLKGLSILAIARAVAADLQVSTSLLLAQFEPKLNLAYAGSIALPQVKNHGAPRRGGRR